MDTANLQQQLFGYLKNNLPPHISMVDELCELLQLSPDSVYRRIRGEKPITLTELKHICEHYKLSLDQLLQLENETVLFLAPGLNSNTKDFSGYLQGALAQLKHFNSFRQKEIQYLCKDLPIWYFYLFPAIGAFKTFFWSKTINNHPELRGKQFSFEEYPFSECFQIAQQMLQEYNQMNTTEIWNLESIHSTINQIAYYKESGNFRDKTDLVAVVESFIMTLEHLEYQAEKGIKFMPGAPEVSWKAPIHFYVNELILGSNSVLMKLDNQVSTLITYGVLNYLISSDERFTSRIQDTFNTLLSRSILISGTGEKERSRFFNRLRDKVNALKNS